MRRVLNPLLLLLAVLLLLPQWGCQSQEPETKKEASPQKVKKEEIKKVSLPSIELPKEPPPVKETAPLQTFEEVSVELAKEKRCLSCHGGIEVISYRMAKMWGADTKCEVCHRGNPTAHTKKEAHKGMIAHPGDLRVQSLTCGQCHDDSGVFRKDVEGLIPGMVRMSRVVSSGERNHTARVLRNSMATCAGEIAITRYLWGSQEDKVAQYGVREIDSLKTKVSKGIMRLKPLPPANTSHADHLLRSACLKCHLWTRGEEKRGLYRAGGCDACHVLYADDGLSRTGDPTISKTAPGHPVKHEITIKVTVTQCMHCHNNEGARVGFAYTGKVQSRGSLPYQPDGTQPDPTYGVCVLPLNRGDVHYDKGLSCIDCHTTRELHGDGTLYGTMKGEVGIRCESCHGTPYEVASLKDGSGRLLTNLYRQGDEVIQVAKITGKKHTVPQLERLMARSALPAAMSIPGHVKKLEGKNQLECYACHGLTVPQYYGYSFKRDDRKVSPVDWVVGTGERVDPSPSEGKWSIDYAYLRWEDPVLGINTKGRVSTYLPLYQGFLTHISEEGETIVHNQFNKTASGLPGLCMVPIQPHTNSKRALNCAYCHSDDKALGQYSGGIDTVAQGWPVNFPLERIVDEQGIQIQETFYSGARPFEKGELDRVNRINSCLSCHKMMENEDAWKEVTDIFGLAETNAKHNEAVKRVFRKGTVR
jgi:hypothetical protein